MFKNMFVSYGISWDDDLGRKPETKLRKDYLSPSTYIGEDPTLCGFIPVIRSALRNT